MKRDLRANQKERTREALVAAAKDLARAGAADTVAEAAEHARVSRATAYRYFPTQESLLVEVSDVTPMVAPVEDMLAKLDGDDAEGRLAKLIDTFIVSWSPRRCRCARRCACTSTPGSRPAAAV